MRLKTKFILALGSIFLVLFALTIFVTYQNARMDHFRSWASLSQQQILTTTDLRARIRQLILESYEKIFNSDRSEVSLQKLEHSQESIRTLFEKLKTQVQNEKSLYYPNSQNEEHLLKEISEIEVLQQGNEQIYLSLKQAYLDFLSGHVVQARNRLVTTNAELFQKVLLEKINTIIENENQEILAAGDQFELEMKKQKLVLYWFTVLALFLTVLVGYLLESIMARRLNALEAATKRVTQGEFNQSLNVQGGDEIASLTHSFNLMFSSLHEAKSQVRRQQEQIMGSSKMSALGEIAGSIAHEINNPLTVVHAKTVQLKNRALQGDMNPEKFVTELEKIEKTALRITRIVRGLKTLSRHSEKDPFESINLKQLIEDTVELCQERLRTRSIELKISCDVQIHVECRSAQISQVLANLIVNALDAIENLPEKWIHIEAVVVNSQLKLSVIDSGLGIPRPIVSKMLEPFFTTKPVGKGTGLGLSISKEIIKNHNGQLFYDEASAHTKFTVLIPLQQKQIAA